jgi:prepilin-type N-terminal cleavage/methylation domain-containing protein
MSHYLQKGFTLIEVLALVTIVAILAAIAAPGYLSFSNQRRANTVRNQILQEIRLTQTEAQRTRRAKVLTFIEAGDSGLPELSRNGIRSTLGDAEWGAGAVSLNVQDYDGISLDELIFLADGTPTSGISTTFPIKITVAVPSESATKRCVIIQTLLGATRLGENHECD